MRSFFLERVGLGFCLAMAVAGAPQARAQIGEPASVRAENSFPMTSAAAVFEETLTPFVPVSHRVSDTASCGECGLSCGCPATGDFLHGGCPGDLCTRESLSNGLWGLQPELAKKGVVYEALLTQFYQGVASGGRNESSAYGGKFDQFVTFNSKELGLWEGMQIVLHAETRFGANIIQDAVPLAASNGNMLYPSLENGTAITGLQATQLLSEEWAVTVGKINALDLFYGLYPQTGRGVSGFMNTSMILPLNLARTIPLSFLGAGLIRLQDAKYQSGVLVYDSHNCATTSGFENLFANGANTLGFWRFFTEFGGRPGSHMFLGNYASGDFTSLDRTGWSVVPGQGVVAPSQAGSWSLTYILEQQLWVDPCRTSRNVGLLSSWGIADEETSPYRYVVNAALQGQGLIPGRDNDSMGVGYFYNGISGDLKSFLPLLNLDDVHGVELYYNAAIAPWFQLSADLQVVDPALGGNDTAVVAGLRATIVP